MNQQIPSDPGEIIRSGSQMLGLRLKPETVEKMAGHLRLLLEWTKITNLTAIRNPADAAVYHFLDSLTVLKILPKNASQLLDVGSGGGFPGVVIAVALPDLKITLLDPNPRKIIFLKEVGRQLRLYNITYLNFKVEDLIARPEPPGFDAVVNRAYSSKTDFIEKLAPLINPGGRLIYMGGPASIGEAPKFRNFVETDHWQGTLPYSSRTRRVGLYAVEERDAE